MQTPASNEAPVFARDMDLVREILLWAERGGEHHDQPEGDEVKLAYHCVIMQEAELIVGHSILEKKPSRMGTSYSKVILVKRLTWKGHEFLEAARKDTVWNKVKAKFAAQGVPLVTEILVATLKKALAGELDLSL